MLRAFGILMLAGLLLASPVFAEVTLSLGWERPVRFKVVDAETGEAVAKPLVLVGTTKEYPGAPAPLQMFEVLRGNSAGLIEYQASEKTSGVELRVTASGYALLIKKVHWKDLPPRQQDRDGFDLGPAPLITIELKNLARSGEWAHNFKLNIGPALEEYLELVPPAMTREGKKAIADFLDKERGRLLGF